MTPAPARSPSLHTPDSAAVCGVSLALEIEEKMTHICSDSRSLDNALLTLVFGERASNTIAKSPNGCDPCVSRSSKMTPTSLLC